MHLRRYLALWLFKSEKKDVWTKTLLTSIPKIQPSSSKYVAVAWWTGSACAALLSRGGREQLKFSARTMAL
jgi:hypothetical protein